MRCYHNIFALVCAFLSLSLVGEAGSGNSKNANKNSNKKACDQVFGGELANLLSEFSEGERESSAEDGVDAKESNFYRQGLSQEQANMLYGKPTEVELKLMHETSNVVDGFYKLRDIQADTRAQMARTKSENSHLSAHKQQKILNLHKNLRLGQWQEELSFLRDYFGSYIYAAELVLATNAWLKDSGRHIRQFPQLADLFFRALETFTKPERADANVALIRELASFIFVGETTRGAEVESDARYTAASTESVGNVPAAKKDQKPVEGAEASEMNASNSTNKSFREMSDAEFWATWQSGKDSSGPRDSALKVVAGLAKAIGEFDTGRLPEALRREDAVFEELKRHAAEVESNPRDQEKVRSFLEHLEGLFLRLEVEAYHYNQGDGLTSRMRRAVQENTFEHSAASNAEIKSLYLNVLSGEIFTFMMRGVSSAFEATEKSLGKWGGQVPALLRMATETWRRKITGITNNIAAGFYWIKFHNFIQKNAYKQDAILYEVLELKNPIGSSAFQQFVTLIGRVSEGRQLLERLRNYVEKSGKDGPDAVNEFYNKQIIQGLEDAQAFGYLQSKPSRRKVAGQIVLVNAVLGTKVVAIVLGTGFVTVGVDGISQFIQTGNEIVFVPLTESITDLGDWLKEVWGGEYVKDPESNAPPSSNPLPDGL